MDSMHSQSQSKDLLIFIKQHQSVCLVAREARDEIMQKLTELKLIGRGISPHSLLEVFEAITWKRS